MIVKINGSELSASKSASLSVIDPKKARNERLWKYTKFAIKVVGITTIIIVAGGGFDYAFASGAIPVGGGFETTSLDKEAMNLYREIVRIGKWLIVLKGGIDIIKCIGDGDFPAAKKHFFSHVMIYLLLLCLPYGMQKVDEIFERVTRT